VICYLIAGKVMKNYTKNECTLDAIAVVEFTKNGAPLNWCQYLLTKMLQAYVKESMSGPHTSSMTTFSSLLRCGNGSHPRVDNSPTVSILESPSYLILGMLRTWSTMLPITMLLFHSGTMR
jgi:hypothetical protein